MRQRWAAQVSLEYRLFDNGPEVSGPICLSVISLSFAGSCFSAISFKRTGRSGSNLGIRDFSIRPNSCNKLLEQKISILQGLANGS